MTTEQTEERLAWGEALESDEMAQAWLDGYGRTFGQFINGMWTPPGSETFPSSNPSTGEVLAHVSQGTAEDVDAAVAAARKAQAAWWDIGPGGRSRHLYALARSIQRQSRLFAVLETLDNGKPIRETRDVDVPLVARHFFHHAGSARLLHDLIPDAQPWGVCGQVIPWNFPLLMLAWKIAPALAAGNTVVLKPAEYTSLSALLFAETCHNIGLPPGVVNIVTGDGRTGAAITEHQDIDKVAFTGSSEVGRIIRRGTSGSGKGLTLELGGKSPYIIFDDADLDSAVEGLVDAIWFNQGQVCCAGSRLLVQESVADIVHEKITERMSKLRIGPPLDKTVDMGAIVDEVQLQTITSMCDAAEDEGWMRVSAPLDAPDKGWWFPPTMFPNVSASATIAQEEVFGPVLVTMTFRSPEEAIALGNNTRYGLAGTVWTQDLDTALEVARRIKAGVIWINCTNHFDANAGFGGYRESGYGREGGLEGLRAYVKSDSGGPDTTSTSPSTPVARESDDILDRTAKMYIGGKQARPDGGYSYDVTDSDGVVIGQAGLGNRKDVRNAVEAASKATGWSSMSGHQRSQILWYIAENLQQRSSDLAQRIESMTGCSSKEAAAEVDASIDRWTFWASWASHYDGAVHDTPVRSVVLALNEAVGVVALVCPERWPLLGLTSLAAPLLATGNSVVALPSSSSPLSAVDLYHVLEASDLPAGVLNIITGVHEELVPVLARHDGVDMIWHAGASDQIDIVEAESVGNLKRTWCPKNFDPTSEDAASMHLLRQATHIKNIWIPHGI